MEKEGEVTVPAKTIADFVNNLSPGNINLLSEKEKVQVKAEGTTSTIAGMNSSDFPSIPSSVAKDSFDLPTEDFTDALSKVLFATSVDETRPILTGVLFVFKKGEVSLVATDGFRLSQKKLKSKSITKSGVAILPKTALSEVTRTAKSENLTVSLQGTDN